MKFTVNREKLQKALQRVGSIIGSRSMFPVLGNVLMQAEDNVLTLTTTDLEIRISTKIEAAVEVPGEMRNQPFHAARSGRRGFSGSGAVRGEAGDPGQGGRIQENGRFDRLCGQRR